MAPDPIEQEVRGRPNAPCSAWGEFPTSESGEALRRAGVTVAGPCKLPDGHDGEHSLVERRLVKVAVGLDYETDSPWVWTGDKVVEDCEDASGWFVVEVPESMADRFLAAVAELDAATTAIHEHAGYDAEWTRLGQACSEFTAEPVIVGGRTYHDDCDRCGWKKEDHRGS